MVKDDGYKELFKILAKGTKDKSKRRILSMDKRSKTKTERFEPKKKITLRLLKASKKKNVCSGVLAECLVCLKCS